MKGSTYLIVVFGILVAKALGFGRNIIFASAFGASELTDIYFQVFGIATFVFTGIGTALATLVIKNLNKAENKSQSAQKQYVSYFIGKISLIILAATALMYLLTGPIVKMLLPGLSESGIIAAKHMMYIMLPSGLFIIVAYIMSGVLQNCKVFFITSIMSLPYNVIIIAALFMKNLDIYDISWITTLGWFLHIVILLPDFYRKGFRFFYRDKSLKKGIVKERNLEVLYIFISSMMFQMCYVFDKAAVSHDSGAATTINYATNFFVTIASVFVVAMSNVSFPSISKNYESGNKENVKKMTRQLIALLFAIIVPFILVAVIFGGDIMSLLYERGKFTRELTNETAILFIIYTFGIFGYICQELFNKILYLGSRYRFPVISSIVIMAIKPIINIFAVNYGVYAVAITTTALFTGYAVIIAYAITKVTGNYFSKELAVNLLKILFAGACALCVYFVYHISGITVIGGKLEFILPLAACGVVYIAVVWASGLVKVLLPKKATEQE